MNGTSSESLAYEFARDTEARLRKEQDATLTQVLALVPAFGELKTSMKSEVSELKNSVEKRQDNLQNLMIAILLVVLLLNPMIKDLLTLLLKLLSA